MAKIRVQKTLFKAPPSNCWIPRSMRRRFRNKDGGSGGTSKNKCQLTPMSGFFARSSRAYKHPGYSEWCRIHKG